MIYMAKRKSYFSVKPVVVILLLALMFITVWFSGPISFLKGFSDSAPLHTILETFSVAVSALIFGLGYSSYSTARPVNLLIFSSMFLAVALIDVAHFLSAVGMPDFVTPNGIEKAINFWLAARFIAALALLMLALFSWRTCRTAGVKYWLLGASLLLTTLVYWLGLFYEDTLPETFVAGTGLTSFKIGAEYFLIGLHAITALFFMRKLNSPQPFDVHRLLIAVIVMMLSELCFTLYSGAHDAFNLLGHVYKVIAYALLYKAMFVDIVKEPFLRLHEAERNVWNAKERAEVTLASIGDAVITTDIDCNVDNLNLVAEQLTGWTLQDARGRPLDEVFNIVNEKTGEVADNPGYRAIRDGVTVGLANHILLISRSGKYYSIEDSAAPIRDRSGIVLGCVLVFHDVTLQRAIQNQVVWQAAHDALTGLANRVLLNDRLQQAIAHAQRMETLVVVCFVDLDYFKPVNDQYGHPTGDKVLVEMAGRFRQVVRDGDTVARLGGDEFVILLTDIRNMDQVTPALKRIIDIAAIPFRHDDIELKLTASIGVSVFPFDEVDADTLLRHADQALYVVKENGRNGYHLFDADQDKRHQSLRNQIERIRSALHNDELCLHYQPKVNMRTGEVFGMEALLRWQHPERGLVPPMEFLPLIENSDLIIEVGEWVISHALMQMQAWLRDGLRLTVSVNIAARHLQLPDFVERIDICLDQFPGILSGQLELEVLESAALDDIEHVRSVITACLERGINFALDDFGTGYSSLSYLKKLPAQTLKIDQTFVREILDDPDDLALTEAVIGLGATFQRKIIAEGVETVAHGTLLMRLGCDLAQGYGIARPMPPEAVLAWVENYKPDPEWALWGNISWEMADFPLMAAQHDHLKWVKQVTDTLDGLPLRMSAEQFYNTQHFRFGLWYQGRGGERYGHLQKYAVLGQMYEEVHKIGLDMVRLYLSGKVDDARGRVPELLAFKEIVLAHLVLFQQQVVLAYGAEGENV